MTRKKVNLAYIPNDSERKASYKKRKRGLIKKVSELSTLCGVEACAVIYSKYELEPEVWPSPQVALAVFSRFYRLPEMDKSRKMVNQEGFLRERIKKTEDQLARLRKENKRKEMENFMYQCMAGMVSMKQFNSRNASEMTFFIRQTLGDIKSRMKVLRMDNQNVDEPHTNPLASDAMVLGTILCVPQSSQLAPPPPPRMVPSSGKEHVESYPWSMVDGSVSNINGVNDLQNYGIW